MRGVKEVRVDIWQKPTQYCNYPSNKNELKKKLIKFKNRMLLNTHTKRSIWIRNYREVRGAGRITGWGRGWEGRRGKAASSFGD